jgi:SH3 domain protein
MSNAETNYIRDELYVPLRSGPTTQHRIVHRGLKSGLALERLNESDDGDWIQIKTPGGLEGWVQAQYISRSPTAAILLAQTRKELKEISVKYTSAKETLNKEIALRKKTQSSLLKTEKGKQQATMDLHRIRSISSGAIELDQKYQRLLEEHELLQTENDTLNAENSSLKDDRRFSFMFYGAALVVFGMFLSVIIPRLQFKKRNSEWIN